MVVIGRLLVSLIALFVELTIAAFVFVADVVSIEGCAICDNYPPNYVGAAIITVIGVMLAWIVFLG